MGFLTFDIINLDKRSRKVISVVGKWHLKRDADLGNLKGHFLLILKKIKGKWLIVADHSS
jgi:ketosteroid isomerase-like protein